MAGRAWHCDLGARLMLRICTFKWKARPDYRSQFTSAHVNVLRHMVDRHYTDPHEFVCITDDAAGIEPGIRVIKLWDDHADVRSPHGMHQPSCYRRLKLFSKEAKDFIGERFVCLDLDTVIVGDMRPLWNRPEDFCIWGDSGAPGKRTWYNGSMFMLRAGTRTKVWTEFVPSRSPREARNAGCFGSDQGWLSFILGKGEARWTERDGCYSYRVHVQPRGAERLPDNAKIVFFHGKHDPWGYGVHDLPWVKEFWR
jgi:hypothetical protein